MIKAVRRNKAKIWIKTYGKAFLLRRALKLAQAYSVSSQYMQQARAIRSANGDPSKKNKAISNLRIRSCQAIDHLNVNEGFANKEGELK